MKHLLLGAALGALTAASAVAQSTDDVIVVTGTRAEGRTALESTAPVDVISAGTLENNGSTELNVALSYALPSFNFPQPAITDGTDHVRPATLRGLGPDQTLVLVNSRRRHASALVNLNGSVGRGSSAVDLNTIPVSAIGRVEVLRDGASAQYGSDAIAGVINVGLREAREGGQVTASFGQYATDIPLVDQPRSASDGDTTSLSGWVGLPLGAEGFLTLSAEYRDREPTNRAGPDTRQQYPSLPGGGLDPREQSFDRINHRFGLSASEALSLFANAGLPINADAELYGWASYQQRDGQGAGFYRRAQDSRNVPAIYPDGFLPYITTDVEDISVLGGVRGDWAEWGYDFSLGYGRNELGYGVENSVNTSMGANSPTSFDAGALIYDQLTANADFQRNYAVDAFAGPLSVAVGLEYRLESYEIEAGEEASYINGGVTGPNGEILATGSQVFPGFQPSNVIDEDRDSIAAYIDLETDVTDRFTVSAAARAESYSDFGETVTGKLAARYQLTDALALRGAVSNGFRAPSLQQAYFTSTSTVFTGTPPVPVEVGTFPATSPVAAALGGEPLEAEESLNISGGLVFAQGGFTLTVDAYAIDIDDRIVLSENLSGPDVEALLVNAGITNITSARFFINGVETETRGVDVVASYGFETADWGDFDLTFGANFTDTEVTDAPTSEVLPGVSLFARREIARFEVGQPENKLIGSVDWSRGPFAGYVRATRFGETVDPGTAADGSGDEVLSPKTIVDAEFSADITDGLNVAFGANNLFDEYPDVTAETPALDGTFSRIFPFSGFSPFGFSGRYVYGRIRYSW
ncbi:TonB-dependent receptor plug domain-containing protein [Maricaulis virginensis]|uniref:TonB-dependent receptor n=1 Tax=Maricaulis virginensis TaxID=144022 RepID=A0A9W6IKK4_9PROT|nr:TonB-dependent receptor [Maricaulis virginensis]GLK50661.1 TonB-dependent receptor [Maricaulis virginensis]